MRSVWSVAGLLQFYLVFAPDTVSWAEARQMSEFVMELRDVCCPSVYLDQAEAVELHNFQSFASGLLMWDRVDYLTSLWASARNAFRGVPILVIQRDCDALHF